MAKGKVHLKYALDKDGNLAHVDSVPNGLECNCYCPNCHDKLMAKHEGKKYAHFFAHMPGADCVGAVESVLHKMAKEVLMREKKIMLPSFASSESRQLCFDEVKTEVYYPELSLRPDCIGYYGDKFLWIEFKRSHEVDSKKKGKIISAKIECIEIDINDCLQDYDELKNFLIECDSSRIWIYNSQFQDSSPSEGKKRNVTPFDYDSEYKNDRQIKRRFALEELGNNRRFVDVLQDEINQNTHTYYCPSCKKEVTLNVTNCGDLYFEHVNPKDSCTDIQYLYGSARESIRYKFMTSDVFLVKMPRIKYCKYRDKCGLYVESNCCHETSAPVNIKKYKYNNCILNHKADIIETNGNMAFLRENKTNPIYLNFNIPGCEHESVDINERSISINVDNQYDIIKFLQGPICGKDNNFKDIYIEDTLSVMNHNVYLFVLKSDGSFYWKNIECCNIHKEYIQSNYDEILIMSIELEDKNINYLQCLFVWYCIKRKLHINKCLLCKSYASWCDSFFCKLTNKDTMYNDAFNKCDNAKIDIDIFHRVEEGVNAMKIHIIKDKTI